MFQTDAELNKIPVNEHVDSTVNALRDANMGLKEAIENGGDIQGSFQTLMDSLTASGVDLAKRIIAAVIIYFIGRWLIKMVDKIIVRRSNREKYDKTVGSFLGSLVRVTLNLMLIVAIIATLGIETSSFAALFTAAGMAIGMALSGQLSNFAAGVLILIFKPYKVNEYIDVQGFAGTVKEIQIFHTVLLTPDNKTIIMPNSVASGNSLINISRQDTRRVDWKLSIDYGSDFGKAQQVIRELLDSNQMVLRDPDYTIVLGEMADSSINIIVRAWVNSGDYWTVYFWFNETVYSIFNEKGISFAYPHMVVTPA